MNKNLEISTATVSIKLITVDNKKMTKSVFMQIQKEAAFDIEFNFIGSNILGYVMDDSSKYLLWVNNNGELRKTSLYYLEDLSTADIDPSHRNNPNDFWRERQVCEDFMIDFLTDKKAGFPKVQEVIKKARNTLQNLNCSQLYIAI